jgi:hypothetical protein
MHMLEHIKKLVHYETSGVVYLTADIPQNITILERERRILDDPATAAPAWYLIAKSVYVRNWVANANVYFFNYTTRGYINYY